MKEKLLSYETFKKEIQEEIKDRLFDDELIFGEEKVITTNETLDAWGVDFQMENILARPILYPSKMYESYQMGGSIEAIADEASYDLLQTLDRLEKMPDYDRASVEEHIKLTLVNTKENPNVMLNCPYETIEGTDLVSVPKWQVDDMHSFLVREDYVKCMYMTPEEVMEIARKNTEQDTYTMRNMDEVLRDVMKKNGYSEKEIEDSFWDEPSPFWVMQNESHIDGSSVLLSDRAMQEMHNTFGEDFYVLAVHRNEIMTISDSQMDDVDYYRELLSHMSQDIPKDEYLSSELYHYNGLTHELSVADQDDRSVDMENESYILSKSEQTQDGWELEFGADQYFGIDR